MADKRILIIDDDQFLRDMYAIKFKENGFSVETATGVAEAVDRLKGGEAPDVILFDVVMPGMDGYAFLESVKEAKLAQNAIKIALSNQGQDVDIDRAIELGAQGYIVKANTVPSEVVSRVLEIVGKHA